MTPTALLAFALVATSPAPESDPPPPDAAEQTEEPVPVDAQPAEEADAEEAEAEASPAEEDEREPKAEDPPAPEGDPEARFAKPAPPDAPAEEPSDDITLGINGIPALAFSSDAGFGFGAIGSLFFNQEGYEPYRARVMMQLFMTTRLIQDHNLRLDILDIGGLPLRLQARGGYFQTIAHNYCGLGNEVTCDPAEAVAAANAAGLSGEERDRFVNRYYLMRFIRLRAMARLRWALKTGKHRVELFGGWRGTGYITGDYVDEDGDGDADFAPYPGSKYAQDFPDGESGFASVFQAGIILDSRDHEPNPTTGYWVEAHVRGAAPVVGSTWSFVGANLTARGYVPLTPQRNLILTSKLLFDVSAGDMPTQEIIRVNDDRDMTAFGGVFLGRGIREQRYVGKLKAIEQMELRWEFAKAEFWAQRFDFMVAGFTDAGWIGSPETLTDFGGDPAKLLVSYGGSFRINWNRNFVVYVDLGFSPIENHAMQTYINVNQLW
jgi:hypothetical protein